MNTLALVLLQQLETELDHVLVIIDRVADPHAGDPLEALKDPRSVQEARERAQQDPLERWLLSRAHEAAIAHAFGLAKRLAGLVSDERIKLIEFVLDEALIEIRHPDYELRMWTDWLREKLGAAKNALEELRHASDASESESGVHNPVHARNALTDAAQALKSARLLLEAGDLDGAADRTGAAALHAARAALLRASVPVEFGKPFCEAVQLQAEANHTAAVEDRTRVEDVLHQVVGFVEAVRRLADPASDGYDGTS